MGFDIFEHKHRFAAWAASRAASVKTCRFSVEHGRTIIEHAGLDALRGDPERLPVARNFDATHAAWRSKIIAEAKQQRLAFTHGIAAKLINVYLKTVFVVGGHHEHERVSAIHPPIDAVLLKKLASEDIGGQRPIWCASPWSKLDSAGYERVIAAVRHAMHGAPLWAN